MGCKRHNITIDSEGTHTIKLAVTRSPMYIMVSDTLTAVFCVDYWTNEITYLFKSRDIDATFAFSNNYTELTISNISKSKRNLTLLVIT